MNSLASEASVEIYFQEDVTPNPLYEIRNYLDLNETMIIPSKPIEITGNHKFKLNSRSLGRVMGMESVANSATVSIIEVNIT